jgi:hypothetical protein
MWGISSNYPHIDSYASAKRVFDTTKPLRGTDTRPLDQRSSRAKAYIEKRLESYVVRLYSTDIVTYYPDGSFLLKTGGWGSQTTAAAMSAMSPCTAWLSKGNFIVANRSGLYVHGQTPRFLVERGGLLFDTKGEPVNPPVAVQYKKRVKKDVAKKVREYFKTVPPMIEAFALAFMGGVPGDSRGVPWERLKDWTYALDGQLTSMVAVSYLDYDWDGTAARARYNGLGRTKDFWSDVYEQFDVIEQYGTELPYGEVPR